MAMYLPQMPVRKLTFNVGADVKKLTFTNLPIGNYDAAVVTVNGKTYKSGLRGSDGRTPVDGEITVTDGTELDIAVTKRDGNTETGN